MRLANNSLETAMDSTYDTYWQHRELSISFMCKPWPVLTIVNRMHCRWPHSWACTLCAVGPLIPTEASKHDLEYLFREGHITFKQGMLMASTLDSTVQPRLSELRLSEPLDYPNMLAGTAQHCSNLDYLNQQGPGQIVWIIENSDNQGKTVVWWEWNS